MLAITFVVNQFHIRHKTGRRNNLCEITAGVDRHDVPDGLQQIKVPNGFQSSSLVLEIVIYVSLLATQ